MAEQWQIRRGTTAENDDFVGAVGELTMDTEKKQIRIHDGSTQGGVEIPSANTADYVVESQFPTADNNYTWYRKYKSGWVEQGGYDNSTSSTVSVSFLIGMANTNYTAVCAYNATDADLSNGALTITSRTTTGFSIKKWSNDRTCWQVSGMAA